MNTSLFQAKQRNGPRMKMSTKEKKTANEVYLNHFPSEPLLYTVYNMYIIWCCIYVEIFYLCIMYTLGWSCPGMNVFPAWPSSADAITEVWAEVSSLGLLPTDPRRAATVGPGQTKNIKLSESALPHLFIFLERNSSLMVLYDCCCHRELRNVPTCSSSRTNNRRNKDVTLFLPYATSARQLSVYWGQHFSTSAYNGVVCHHIRGRASPDFRLFRL